MNKVKKIIQTLIYRMLFFEIVYYYNHKKIHRTTGLTPWEALILDQIKDSEQINKMIYIINS